MTNPVSPGRGKLGSHGRGISLRASFGWSKKPKSNTSQSNHCEFFTSELSAACCHFQTCRQPPPPFMKQGLISLQTATGASMSHIAPDRSKLITEWLLLNYIRRAEPFAKLDTRNHDQCCLQGTLSPWGCLCNVSSQQRFFWAPLNVSSFPSPWLWFMELNLRSEVHSWKSKGYGTEEWQ